MLQKPWPRDQCCRNPDHGIKHALHWRCEKWTIYTPLHPVHARFKLQLAEHLGLFQLVYRFSCLGFCQLFYSIVLEKHLVARYTDFPSRYSYWSGGCPFGCKLFTLSHLHLTKMVSMDSYIGQLTWKPRLWVYSKYKLKISSAKRLASIPPAPGTTCVT